MGQQRGGMDGGRRQNCTAPLPHCPRCTLLSSIPAPPLHHRPLFLPPPQSPGACREFQTPDEEMKKIVLKVVKQCVGTDGVEPDYIRAEILPEFFKHFWVRRMALDRRNYRALVETTVEVAGKVGGFRGFGVFGGGFGGFGGGLGG